MKPFLNCPSYLAIMASAKQYLLVANMFGIEGQLCAEIVAMVTNLRVLGVPVAYSSLPSFFAAVLSSVIIFGLSFVSEKYATKKRGKALLLVAINLLQCTGSALVLLANLIKLSSFDTVATVDINNSNRSLTPSSHILKTNSSQTLRVDSVSIPNEVPVTATESTYNVTDTQLVGDESLLPFPYYAAIAMVGYAFMESGFDTGNCFLKTYALICSPSEIHPRVLVKSTFIASFGGLLVTFLSSLSIGEWLTAGTSYNVNCIKTIFLVCISMTAGIITLCLSLTAGLTSCAEGLHSNLAYTHLEEEKQKHIAEQRSKLKNGEKKFLLMGEARKESEAEAARSLDISVHVSLPSLENFGSVYDSIKTLSCSLRGASSHHNANGSTKTNDSATEDDRKKKTASRTANVFDILVLAIRQNRFRILLCLATFAACWATFSFGVYSVNFVGTAIYKGDPSAPVNSKGYERFLEGERAGATGLFVTYLVYMAVGAIQNTILQKFGWWREALVAGLVFTLVNFGCAYFLVEWLYYVASAMNGFYRVMNFTVPYLLISKPSNKEQPSSIQTSKTPSSNPYDSPDPPPTTSTTSDNVGIALIAAMWPASFLLAGALTGPVISWTGLPAASVYATAIMAAIALLFHAIIRKH